MAEEEKEIVLDDKKRFEVDLEFIQCLANPVYLTCKQLYYTSAKYCSFGRYRFGTEQVL